ncbi:MAG: hypothetical protein A2W19_09825 [Spirochaetes bacterium RBG_16_49_21]|nr:MAG: hypothetical protein A2W19_09825 [Spirochaetes bacterium RBG_16_49_21]
MNTAHIPFQKMSDLYDNDIRVMDERNAVLEHIGSCGNCTTDYERLEKTLRLVQECACICYPPDALCVQTMQKIKLRRKKKLLVKSIPSIAASVLVIAGVGLFNAGVVPASRQSIVADKNMIRSLSDSEQVIRIIRKHNASISDVTDSYVEGTAPLASFKSLRRDLGYRKVAYVLVEESNQGVRDWGSAIEEVGAGDVGYWDQKTQDIGIPQGYIRFRVFR